MFGRRKESKAEPAQLGGALGADLRQMVLDLQPGDLGMPSNPEDPVFGFVMDSTFDDGAWFTLVCLKDGTVSLYTSGTFAVIGGGQHPHIRAPAAQLLERVGNELAVFRLTTSRELPPPGMVTLRALTAGGQREVTAAEDELGNERHPASSLFHGAHDVIMLVRSASNARSAP